MAAPFRDRLLTELRPSASLRIIAFLFTMAVGVVVAELGYRSFVNNLSNFLDVLLVIFIPWSAVNLTDYFLVRRAHYDVPSFFIPDGVYGRLAWRGLLAYAIGLGLEVPFVSQTYYTGVFVKHLGGADISWLVGFAAAALAYFVLARAWPIPAPEPRPAPAGAA
jgi:nucleobase:cation symporter-1, NCS1 family